MKVVSCNGVGKEFQGSSRVYTVAFRPEALCWNRVDNRVAGECEKPDKDWKRHLYRGGRLFVFVLHELYDKPEAAQPH